MNESGNEPTRRNDPVEALLGQASPRPVPPAEDAAAVRAAVHAEWRSVVAGRRRRSRLTYAAVAASLLAAVTVLVTTLLSGGVQPVPVATIDKSHGTIYLLGNRSERIELAGVATIHSTQVIETGQHSGLGLTWNKGGSLRVDADTRIEFPGETTVFLHRGRIYFDTGVGGSDTALVVDTEHGSITHIGTQYMAAAGRGSLIVSVREGKVRIDGHYHEQTAGAGKQVEIRGSARPIVAELPGHGDAWAWTEAMSPNIDLDNRSAYEFLQWVGRETGHEIVFTGTEAEGIARGARLVGTVQADPRTELRLRMMTTDLEYRFDAANGTIEISMIGSHRH